MKKTTTAERLQQVMADRRIKQVDILNSCAPYCSQFGVRIGKNDLSQYVSGKTQPKQDKLSVLGMALNVSEAWLMGFDVPMLRSSSFEQGEILEGFSPPPKTKKRPRLGSISCGTPIASEENFDGYDDVPENIQCDFTLKCEGDSMIGARILDGDIVYIKQQNTVEQGEIAAVLVDGTEKLLKRVYVYSDSVVLQAENPIYPPLVFSKEDMNRVFIIGKAVAFTSIIK